MFRRPFIYESLLVLTSWQLLHVKTNKFVTGNKRLSGAMERNSMRISLDGAGTEGSLFTVVPFYKHRALTEPVYKFIITDMLINVYKYKKI